MSEKAKRKNGADLPENNGLAWLNPLIIMVGLFFLPTYGVMLVHFDMVYPPVSFDWLNFVILTWIFHYYALIAIVISLLAYGYLIYSYRKWWLIGGILLQGGSLFYLALVINFNHLDIVDTQQVADVNYALIYSSDLDHSDLAIATCIDNHCVHSGNIYSCGSEACYTETDTIPYYPIAVHVQPISLDYDSATGELLLYFDISDDNEKQRVVLPIRPESINSWHVKDFDDYIKAIVND